MKRILFCITFALLALSSCTSDEMPPKISYEFSDVTAFSDFTSCSIICCNESVDGEGIKARLLLSESEDLADATGFPMQVNGDTLSCNLTGLRRGTLYYYGFEMFTNTESYLDKSIYSFKTQEGDVVTVTTFEVTNITPTTAMGGGNVTINGDVSIQERGICWSLHHNPLHIHDSHATNGSGSGWFSVNMTDLLPDTTYYVKAYAVYDNGVALGNEVSFTTASTNQPVVITGQVTNITSTSAVGNGTIVSEGAAHVTERGICWNTDHNPTIWNNHTSNGNGLGSYNCAITGLTSNQTYYVRAYAITEQGVTFGTEVSFTALEGLPEVTTLEITGITTSSAIGKCKVTEQGGSTVTERGICWSNSHNPTVIDNHATSGSGMGNYSVEITGLQANATYFARAYATNSSGTVYGEELSFTTLQETTLPIVSTIEVTNIGRTTALGGGDVMDDGGADITERGICWATSHNPTISSNHAHNGTGTGAYTVEMTGLTQNTTYYVRAYAKNSIGIGYGDEVSFTTAQNVMAPTVTTSQVTNITQTTARGGGNVTSDGGATITERGICWSTSHNPTTNGNHAISGTGTGSYTCNMTGLTPGLTYYVRAYAINSVGTAYGSEVSFTTSQIPSYTISISASPSNGGSVTGGGTYQQGQSCTVIATAATGYTFVRWTENGNQVSTNANYTFTVNGNRTLVAQFQAQNYTISVSASPSNGGSVSGGGNFNYGQNCTVHATANSGYTFTNWTENGSVVSTNANYTFTVTSNRTLVANFTANPQNYTVSVTANPSDGGMVSGGGTYQQGQSCTVSATANYSYSFVHWTENGNIISTNSNYSFTVTSNRTLIAHFAINCLIEVVASPSNGGTVSGGGEYQYGQYCTITANANNGYTFKCWTNGGIECSTNASWTFMVGSSTTYMAKFRANGDNPPTGTVNGKFSVSNTKQVYFAQGNLQYNASTNTWRFATHQYDYIGDNNSNISQTYSGWIDLFGWGTSGYNHGAVCYQPWSTSINCNDYYAYGNMYSNLCDNSGQADWGYNAISNGGNITIAWRTLTINEWQYVFFTRSTSSNIRFAKVQVNAVNGIVLLPDNWSSTYYPLNNTNQPNSQFTSNIISVSQWEILEQHGAVFLPAAGQREGTWVYNDELQEGYYWSSSRLDNEYIYTVGFLYLNNNQNTLSSRYSGNSVRLVRDY